MITDRTAAWLHGVTILERGAHLVAPRVSAFNANDSRIRRSGVRGGRRGLLDRDVMDLGGLRVTTPVRTACDLGRMLWRFDALAGLDGYLRIGVDLDEVLYELPRFRGYRGVCQLRYLAPLADARSESPGESALRLHWYDAGLPTPEPQCWVFDSLGRPVFRVDLGLPELRYAAEYDGEEFHTDDRGHRARRRASGLARRAELDRRGLRQEDLHDRRPGASAPAGVRAGSPLREHLDARVAGYTCDRWPVPVVRL